MREILQARAATPCDAGAIARIYSIGIAERVATFETGPHSEEDVLAWFQDDLPKVVLTKDSEIVAFAVAYPYSDRCCYASVAEFSVYVDPEHRGIGAGRTVMQAFLEVCRGADIHKVIAKVISDNERSLRLMETLGFERVGVHRRHGTLDGQWKDVTVLEKLL